MAISTAGTADAYLGETGQLVSRSNGVVATTWTYDTNLNDRKLIAIANKPAASAYQFPNNAPEGDIQGIVDSFNGQTWTLGYDDADRLRTAASSLGPADGYTPDPADNLVRISRPTGSIDVPPNALNQAVRANHSPYSYDADGQLVADASRTYAWDAENRLVGIGYVNDSSVVTTFRYDGLGRRIAIGTMQGGSTVETHYGWCGSTLCQSRTGADAPLRRYLAEGEVTPGENALDYYAVDQLGSVRDALDATNGTSVAHYDYEWYGVPLGMPKASATDFRYAGLFLEQRSGLYLSATRAYDPVVGRWLSRDPIGEAGGVNLYGYVEHNPVSLADPNGEQALPGAVAGLVIGGIAGYASTHTLRGTIVGGGVGALAGFGSVVAAEGAAAAAAAAGGGAAAQGIAAGAAASVVGGVAGGGAAYVTGQDVVSGAIIGAASPALSGEAIVGGFAVSTGIRLGFVPSTALSVNSAGLGYLGGLLAPGPGTSDSAPQYGLYIGPGAYTFGASGCQ